MAHKEHGPINEPSVLVSQLRRQREESRPQLDPKPMRQCQR
jgi:hypothetical protein